MAVMDGSSTDLADVRTPLLRNHWYVAGYASDFDDGLHERTFLNRSILIFRAEDGALVGLQNRCAHRSYPLAHGWREGDAVRCRYHGAKYNRFGEMIDFPSMAKCPRISIRRYPMRVSGSLAWIWMGDEDAAIPELPQTPWLQDDCGWAYATGSYELRGNWLLMAENLMDLTHIPFLHQASFSFPKAFAEAPVRLNVDGDRLSFHRDNPPGYQRSGFLTAEISDMIEASGFDARSAVNFVSPAFIHGGGHFDLHRPVTGAQPHYEWQVIHFVTPVTQETSRYVYFFARNYQVEDQALTDRIRTMVVAGFEEDRTAIELVQAMHDGDDTDFREAHFRSDGPSVAMRRIVAAMARREQDGDAASATAPISEAPFAA